MIGIFIPQRVLLALVSQKKPKNTIENSYARSKWASYPVIMCSLNAFRLMGYGHTKVGREGTCFPPNAILNWFMTILRNILTFK